MMWWSDGAWGAGDWFSMVVTMLLLWALLAAGVMWLIGLPRGGGTHPTADEILLERFARGDIDAAEYDRRRSVMERSPDVHSGA